MPNSHLPPTRPTDPLGEFPMDLPEYLFHLQLYAVRCRNRLLDPVAEGVGLNLARYRAMVFIDWFQPCTMKELADFSLADRTTMTRTVDGLVENGWVDRSRSAEDRREVLITLTPAGVDKMREGYPGVWALNREALVGISDREQRELIRLTQKVFANLAPTTTIRQLVLRVERHAGQTSPSSLKE